jgi:enamine deaminase RidA (YjgF/YER057c/UK114 family)
MTQVEDRLRALGLTLPPTRPPVANYVPTKRSGNLLFVSGKVSALRGEVGTEVDPAAARLAARDTMLELLALIRQDLGDLDQVASIEQVRGFVRSAPSFTGQPAVIDGASDLLVELFRDAGRHARTATGTNQLPFGAAVQLDMVLRLSG